MRIVLAALVLLVAPVAAAEHRHELFARTGLTLHLGPGQTAGGVGGAIGLRRVIDERFLLQGDAGWLAAIGSVLSLRAAAGVQRSGTWMPAAFATLTVLAGHRLRFVSGDREAPVAAPPLSLGLALAPFRFGHEGATVSLFEFGLGAGWDFPGRAAVYQVSILEVGARFR
jgi:hypothetical protein